MRILITLLLTCLLACTEAQVTTTNFNSGTLGQGLYNTTSSLCNPPNDGYLTDSFSYWGGKSFRTMVQKVDGICGYSYRSEMHLSPSTLLMQGTEWIGWDTYQPAWQPDDTIPYISGQLHGVNIVPFGLWTTGTKMRVDIQSRANGTTLKTVTYNIGNFAKGQWHRFILHFNRKVDGTGFMQLWADGRLVVDYHGATTDLIGGVPETNGVYFKFGMYKWSIQKSKYPFAVCYVDNVRFGTAAASLGNFQLSASLALLPTNPVCNGSTGSIASSVVGGVSPYTYLWNTGATTANLTNVGAGTYTCTVTDAVGAVTSLSTTLTAPAPLTVTPISGDILSYGGTTFVNVTAAGGTLPYSGTGTITNVAAGTRTFTVTDANGCSTSSTITITQPAALSISAVPGTIACNGGSTSVVVTGSGGNAPYVGTGTFSSTAGVRAYTISDANGNTATTSITIPQPTVLTSSVVYGLVTAPGGTTTVIVTAAGGTAPYTGAGTFTEGSGTHTYTVTDVRGCSQTVTIDIPVSIPNSASSTILKSIKFIRGN